MRKPYRYCVLCWKDRYVMRTTRWKFILECSHTIDRPRNTPTQKDES